LLFKNATNSTTAFQIQSSSSAALFNLDTTNAILTVNAIQESINQYNNPNGGIGQTQNLVTYSEQFNHANWTKTNVTNTANDTVAGPDNYAAFASPLAADTLTATAANGTISQTFTTATNGNYNFSVWLKTSSGTQSVNLRIDSTGATPTTGTAQNYTVGTTWQRYFVTQNFTGTPSNIKPTIQIVSHVRFRCESLTRDTDACGEHRETVQGFGATIAHSTPPRACVASTRATVVIVALVLIVAQVSGLSVEAIAKWLGGL
jgi:hypothetical protein